MIPGNRLHGLDIARFFAFVGMVLVNFRIAAMVEATPGWASSLTNHMEGRAAALFVVLAGLGLADWFARPGRQTLTLYVAHIYLGMGVLEILGWLDGRLTPNAIFAISAGFCAICLVYAALWQKIQSRGPLEWAMRKLTG